MKKCLSLILIALMLMGAFMTGCGNDKVSDKTKETKATEDNLRPSNSKKMLKDYFNSFLEGDNPFYGVWQIEGIEYVNFIFRNDNLAEMVMGSEGSFTQLTINEDNKTVEMSFLIALNGKYKYKFSKDKKTLTLTQENTKQTLKKVENFDIVPEAPNKPKVDKKILGWWKSKEGVIYYFGNDGLMYSNIIMSETFYTYEATDGVIHATYLYPEEVKDSLGYEVTKKGNLKIKGNVFTPYDPYEED